MNKKPIIDVDDTLLINSLILNNDFDEVDKDLINDEIKAANQSDEDDEMAAKFDY